MNLTRCITQIHSRTIEYEEIIDRLFQFEQNAPSDQRAIAFHFDFAMLTTIDKDDLIFSLAVLRGVVNPSSGLTWLAHKSDFTIIELTVPTVPQKKSSERKPVLLLDILPKITCLSPNQSWEALKSDETSYDLHKVNDNWYMGLDVRQYNGSQFQRPYKRLLKVDTYLLPKSFSFYILKSKCFLLGGPRRNARWKRINAPVHGCDFKALLRQRSVLV